jgi:beta-lactamase class A
MALDQVKEVLDGHAGKVIGKIGIGFKNFKTGEEYFINGDDRFPTASVFKVTVLIELFNQASHGKITLNDMYVYRHEDISPGSGIMANLTPGLSICLKDLALLMMTESDNVAADVLYNIAGKENIASTIKSMGLKNTRSDMTCRELLFTPARIPANIDIDEGLKLFDAENYEKDYSFISDMSLPNDISSPRDMMAIFSMIYNKEIIDPQSCQQMMDIMEKCNTNNRIPFLLPRFGERAVKVIHKTGTLEYICNDCGIVVTPEQTYGLVMLYNGFTGDPKDKRAARRNDGILAEISRDIYNVLHEKPAAAE